MNFISLGEILKDFAGNVTVSPRLGADDAEAAKYSEAAGELHQLLHNNESTRPRWVEINETTKKPLFNDAVSSKGMGMLEHMAGWYERQSKERTEHILFCVKAGRDPDTEPPPRNLETGKYKRLDAFDEYKIGFERAEFIHFLAANGIENSLISGDIDEGNHLMPLSMAASYLAYKRYPDAFHEVDAIAILKSFDAGHGSFTPVYALRSLAELRLQKKIDTLVRTGKITLYDPVELTPTDDITHALLEETQLSELLENGVHLNNDLALRQSAADAALPVPQVTRPLLADVPLEEHKGITKDQVITAFGKLVNIKLGKALGDGKGLFGDGGARTQKGTRGGRHKALWNPVLLAVGFHEKNSVPMLSLKKAFVEHNFLKEWSEKWNDALDML